MKPNPDSPPPGRLASIDAYRGAVMTLMMAEVLAFGAVAAAHPGGEFWRLLAYHQSHVEWVGCSLHDLIQPSFSFLVGVALPFSIASRTARGQSRGGMAVHAFWRATVLVALGIFLRSMRATRTNYTFEDTLSQIGLGYGFLFLLGFRRARDQVIALAVVLVGYWAAFALYPLPGPDFDFASVGVPADWPHHPRGFAAHWDKNSNLAWAFDRWFLNRFPREAAFTANGGGYSTLSFIPTLGTMILGLLAGNVLRADRKPWSKVGILAAAGVVLLAAGYALGSFGVCPVVKRIWTPSWVLFSGGWCFLLMAASFAAFDVLGWRRLAFPVAVVGANSIAAYVLSHTIDGFIVGSYLKHLGPGVFHVAGDAYEPLIKGAALLATLWLILFWMYRRRVFVRI